MQDMTTTKSTLPVAMDDVFSIDNLDDLTEGVGGGFGVLSLRGGKWRVKVGGEETLIKDAEGDAVSSIPVVLVKAQKEVSKIYYEKNYEEGDDAAPDCFSLTGIEPDPTAENPQANTCAMCPQNQWGSRITEQGRKAKNCSDNRRVAVVPAARKMNDADPDILANEIYGGGPILFRVSPTALKDLAKYAGDLKRKVGENYNAVVTLLGFDPDTSYPKPTFKAVRRLTSEEKEKVVEFYNDGSVDNILSTAVEHATETEVKSRPAPVKTVDTDFEDDSIPEETPKKVKRTRKAKKAAPVVEAELEDEDIEAGTKGNGKHKPKAVDPRRASAAPADEEENLSASSGDSDMDAGIEDIMDELDGLG